MQCKARTKAGNKCHAPAVERGLCFFHAHPEKLAELGREGGRKNCRPKSVSSDVQEMSLKNVSDVAELLEATINQVRQGQIDLRTSNAVGFLAGILLRALEKGRIEERLADLEAALGNNAGQGPEAFEFRPMETP